MTEGNTVIFVVFSESEKDKNYLMSNQIQLLKTPLVSPGQIMTQEYLKVFLHFKIEKPNTKFCIIWWRVCLILIILK